MAKLYKLTDQNGRNLASFHANQIEENDKRLLDSVALAIGGNRHASINRGHIVRYSDGVISVRPRRADGTQCETRGQLAFYTLRSFEFTP